MVWGLQTRAQIVFMLDPKEAILNLRDLVEIEDPHSERNYAHKGAITRKRAHF